MSIGVVQESSGERPRPPEVGRGGSLSNHAVTVGQHLRLGICDRQELLVAVVGVGISVAVRIGAGRNQTVGRTWRIAISQLATLGRNDRGKVGVSIVTKGGFQTFWVSHLREQSAGVGQHQLPTGWLFDGGEQAAGVMESQCLRVVVYNGLHHPTAIKDDLAAISKLSQLPGGTDLRQGHAQKIGVGGQLPVAADQFEVIVASLVVGVSHQVDG